MTWRQLSDDVVVMSFPWRTLGIDFRRNVTLLRLSDGRVVIHSTAPFTDEDIAAICRFGEPAWLVEATLMHDTFAKEGTRLFAICRTSHRMASRRPAGSRLIRCTHHRRIGTGRSMCSGLMECG
jgi:hypothetical protein